jgi:hypothetical protein
MGRVPATKGIKMKSGFNLNASQAARYINEWIRKGGYSQTFVNDISLLMADNRRVTRSANVIKYGRIPFDKTLNGRISYDFQDIRDFTQRLKVICVELELAKFAKATRAVLTARKPYFEASDAALDQLLSQLV